ncbi:hypothetical protein RF11_03008 [Thelohanellus kitauei]|uniref:Uncharacterized protein n=1 Tax=Thelohanellus kitauei TaxID=669202 RepID=A0A0C2N2P2_THEKT|nr:hypothetical protein RF11_03008 [Thelohanellus kitauei]
MRECLRTVFQVIPFQPHFNNAISIIRQNPGYFSRIESQLFFITGMITETSVLSDFHEVLEIILNFPHDAPSFFIETCCDVLRDFIYHSYGRKNSDDKPTVDYDSIYRWLACVPEEAIVNLGFDVDFDCMEIDQVIKGFEVRTYPNSLSTILLLSVLKFHRLSISVTSWRRLFRTV